MLVRDVDKTHVPRSPASQRDAEHQQETHFDGKVRCSPALDLKHERASQTYFRRTRDHRPFEGEQVSGPELKAGLYLRLRICEEGIR